MSATGRAIPEALRALAGGQQPAGMPGDTRRQQAVPSPLPPFISIAGQAMVELAVFGTFLLFGLAIIVRFGLMQYHSLQTQQEAFRLAQQEAYETRAYNGRPTKRPSTVRPQAQPDNSADVLLVKDVYLPDPTNPFGTGEFVTTVASGTVQWGTDAAELSPKDDDALGKSIYRINDSRFAMLNARFDDKELLYGPNISNQLCAITRGYGTEPVVELLDAAGVLIEAEAGFTFCELGGGAIIQITDDDGRVPVKVRVRIINMCRGDVISPEACKQQCDRIKNEPLISTPSYCFAAPIAPLDKAPAGIDLTNTTRLHDANNTLLLRESASGTTSRMNVNESVTAQRKIHTNRIVTPADVDATTTKTRQRGYQWDTKW